MTPQFLTSAAFFDEPLNQQPRIGIEDNVVQATSDGDFVNKIRSRIDLARKRSQSRLRYGLVIRTDVGVENLPKQLRERPLSLIGRIINDTKGRRAELPVPAKACNELFDVVGLGHPQS